MTITAQKEDEISIEFVAIQIKQPIGPFYIASIRSSDLFKICYMDIRQIRSDGGIDEYLGIQRILNEKRVSEIKRYVNTVDATFPLSPANPPTSPGNDFPPPLCQRKRHRHRSLPLGIFWGRVRSVA